MRNSRRKNNIIIAGLCSILVIMGVGYAAFASQLKITGSSKISSNWDIEITNIESTNIVGSASNKVEPTYTATTATFSTNLVLPGDSITYNVTIENKGTIDGVLKLVDKTDTSNSAINFDTSGVKQGDVLKVGEKTTYTVKVSYNSSVTSQPDNLSSTLTVTFDYIQDDGQDYSEPAPTAAEMLIAKAVTSGDGLYVDSTESGRYVYKGASPENYIKLDSDLYRIMAVESDGTLKVIRKNSIGKYVFDPGYQTNINGVTSSNSTDGTRYSSVSTDYCYSWLASYYYGCKSWGSSTTTLDVSENNTTQMPQAIDGTLKDLPSTEAYLNTYLNNTWYNSLSSDIQSMIVNHIFNIGVIKRTSGQTLDTDVLQEKAYKWKGKIGLMTAVDYVKANTNTELCGTVYLNTTSSGTYSTCKTTNYLFVKSYSDTYWTISPFSYYDDSKYMFDMSNDGECLDYSFVSNDNFYVLPSFFLNSNITLSGSGTETDPYIPSL